MIKDKYKKQEHLIYRLSLLFYIKDIGFINDLATDLMNDNEDDINISRQFTLDILKYGILSNRIIVKAKKGKIYNKSNYKELLEIVENNFDKFLDIRNPDYPYVYDFCYTDYWKKELSKLGLWDKTKN